MEGLECDWCRNAVPLSHLGREFTHCGQQRTTASPSGRRRKSVWFEVVCGCPSCGCGGAHSSQCQGASLEAHLRAKLPLLCNQRGRSIATATQTLCCSSRSEIWLLETKTGNGGPHFPPRVCLRPVWKSNLLQLLLQRWFLLAVKCVRCLFLGNWCFCLVLCLQAFSDQDQRLRVHPTFMQNAGHFEYVYRDKYFSNLCEWKQKDCLPFSLIFPRYYCTVL